MRRTLMHGTLPVVPMILLTGCFVVPHHHGHRHGHGHHDHETEWEQGLGGDEGASEQRGLTPGEWIFELYEPDKHGDCSDADLGGITQLTVEGELVRDGSSLTIWTEFGSLEGFQEGESVAAWGEIEWDGERIELELEGEAIDRVMIDGLLLGGSGDCLIAAQLDGTFVGDAP